MKNSNITTSPNLNGSGVKQSAPPKKLSPRAFAAASHKNSPKAMIKLK